MTSFHETKRINSPGGVVAAVNEIPTEIGTKHIEFGLDGSKKMPELLGFYLFCLLFLS